jgi:hypothetical protein
LEENCLHADQVQGAYEATRHLIELGHRRIAHIAGPRYQQDARDRLEGYRQALSDAGLSFDPRLVIEGDYHEPSGLMAVEALLSRGVLFTAIFSSNDQMAYGARLALYRRGIQVPGEISLVLHHPTPHHRGPARAGVWPRGGQSHPGQARGTSLHPSPPGQQAHHPRVHGTAAPRSTLMSLSLLTLKEVLKN